MFHWLGFHASTAEGLSSIPGQGAEIPTAAEQLMSPCAPEPASHKYTATTGPMCHNLRVHVQQSKDPM